jgi:hypothetical protein
MSRLSAAADDLVRYDKAAQRAVEKSPRQSAGLLSILRLRLVAIREGLVQEPAHETAVMLEQKIAAFERAFGESDRCGRCGRHLEDPVSRKRGVGPDCLARIQEAERRAEGTAPDTGGTP